MNRDIELTDGSVSLRPFSLEDTDRLFEAVSRSIVEVSRWMWWCHPGYSIVESKEWLREQEIDWEKGAGFNFSINDRETGLLLGGCGLNNLRAQDRTADMGYWVRTNHTGKGTATASARLLAGYGFREVELNRIQLIISVENGASRRVAEKIGAEKEGVLRNRLFVGGRLEDAFMFSLIPSSLG